MRIAYSVIWAFGAVVTLGMLAFRTSSVDTLLLLVGAFAVSPYAGFALQRLRPTAGVLEKTIQLGGALLAVGFSTYIYLGVMRLAKQHYRREAMWFFIAPMLQWVIVVVAFLLRFLAAQMTSRAGPNPAGTNPAG